MQKVVPQQRRVSVAQVWGQADLVHTIHRSSLFPPNGGPRDQAWQWYNKTRQDVCMYVRNISKHELTM